MEESRQGLIEVARQIREWQQTHTDKGGQSYSVAAFLKEFPSLGSERVYGRIVGGDLDDLDCGRWLRDYHAVLNLLKMLDEQASEDDPRYDDFTACLDLRRAVAAAMREKGITRLVILVAPPGCGKSTAAELLAARFGGRVVRTDTTELWKESINEMLKGLLKALGVSDAAMPASASARWTELLRRLNETRLCLVIDEAHHLGPRTLNVVKSIINQSPGEVVLLAIDTLWRRLETAAYEEARQLTQNRLLERIRVERAAPADIALMLERRLGMAPDAASMAARGVAKDAAGKGNFTFVKLVCRRARKIAGKGEVTAELVAQAAAHVAGMR